MKQHAKTAIKGILLTFIFIFTFNLTLSQVNYGDFKSPVPIAFADEDVMEFTEEEAAMTPEELEEDDLLDGATGGDAQTVSEILEEQFPQEAYDKEGIVKKIADWSTILHRIFHPMINFLSFQIGNFLGIDYIYEGAMGQMIKLIWTVSRNIVNIIFVLILLALALKQIFDIRGGGESGDLKSYLIKFTLLLIAVNFSWLATKVVLDASNVATNIVFSIPMGVARTNLNIDYKPCSVTGEKEVQGQCYPTAFFYPYDSNPSKYLYLDEENCNREEIQAGYDKAYHAITAEEAEGYEGILKEGDITEDQTNEYWGKSVTCWGNINFIKYDRNTSAVYLTYGMARIQNLIKASAKSSYAQLGVGIFMSLIIQAVYVITLLALFIALIIRMAVLWIFVAFSPFLVLMIFSEKFQMAGEQVTPKAFINWAFVPVKVGAIFTVAFLMISAGQAAGYSLEKLSANEAVTNVMIKFDTLFTGMDSVSEFIWLVMVIAVLWIGVFSVLQKMPIIDKITGGIQELGNRAGKFMAKTPLYAPIVPIYDHKEGKWKKVAPITFDPSNAARKWMNKQEYGDKTGAEITQLGDKAKDAKYSASIISAIKAGSNSINKNKIDDIARGVGVSAQELHSLGEKGVKAAFSSNNNIGADGANNIWSALDRHFKPPVVSGGMITPPVVVKTPAPPTPPPAASLAPPDTKQ